MRGAARTAGASLAALLAACGGDAPPASAGPVAPRYPAPAEPAERTDDTFVAERTLAALLEGPDAYEVVLENPASPVRYEVLRPTRHRAFDGAALRSLVVSPPAEVRIRIPDETVEPGALLEFAVGFDESVVDALAGVPLDIRVDLDDRTVFADRIGRGVTSRRQREWIRTSVPLQQGGELVVRTRPYTSRPVPVPVGVGDVRVVGREYVHRTKATPEHPSLLVVLVDTLRADALDPDLDGPTPGFAALARDGVVFERTLAPSPWTWPSTATLLTGLSPYEHGLRGAGGSMLSHGVETLAEALQSEGFTTAAWVVNPLVTESRGLAQGFETWTQEEAWRPAREVLPGVAAWLRERADLRTFAYVHLGDPHAPYTPPDDVLDEVVAASGSAPYPDWDERRFLELTSPRLLHEPGGEVPADMLAHARARYRAEAVDADRAIAALVEELRGAGLLEHTLVVVTSDHGEEFLEHGFAGHGKQLYDESLRVPLAIAGPGVPAGRTVTHRVRLAEVRRELLALLGVAPPPEHGEGLFEPGRPEFFSMTDLGQWVGAGVRELHGVRRDRWLLVWSPPTKSAAHAREITELHGDAETVGAELVALYDLAADPGATTDVADAHPDVAADLLGVVRARAAEAAAITTLDETALEALEAAGYIEGTDEDG